MQKHGEDKGLKLANRYGKALPASYIEEVTPHLAVADVEAAAALKTPDDIRLSLYRSRRKGDGLRFKLFRYGTPITLSDALPMLENMGLKILSEHPYEMDLGESTISIEDFDVQTAAACEFDIDEVREAFQNAFERIWRGQAENDGFNKLILGAQMDWRQVSMLRGYCKYLLQTGVPFSQAYMEATLNQYPAIAGLLVELFEAKFIRRAKARARTAWNRRASVWPRSSTRWCPKTCARATRSRSRRCTPHAANRARPRPKASSV